MIVTKPLIIPTTITNDTAISTNISAEEIVDIILEEVYYGELLLLDENNNQLQPIFANQSDVVELIDLPSLC